MRRFLIAVPRRRARTVLGVLALACAVSLIAPAGASAATSPTAPRPGAYGYFVDTYKTNTPADTTPETNAATGVLSQFGKLWRPGSSWDNGVAVDAAAQRILDSNIAQAARTTQTRTDAQGHGARQCQDPQHRAGTEHARHPAEVFDADEATELFFHYYEHRGTVPDGYVLRPLDLS